MPNVVVLRISFSLPYVNPNTMRFFGDFSHSRSDLTGSLHDSSGKQFA